MTTTPSLTFHRRLPRLAVVGSRYSITPQQRDAFRAFMGWLAPYTSTVVTGGAHGADTIAAHTAKAHGVIVTVYRPDYGAHGKAAPLARNRLIVASADVVLALWDGASRGTYHTLSLSLAAGLPCHVIDPRGLISPLECLP